VVVRRGRFLVSLLVLAGLSLVGGASASARVSAEFFGVVPQGPLEGADFSRMEGAAGTVRIPVAWYEVEPRQGEFEFGALDRVIGAAADHGIRILPFLYGTPGWISPDMAVPPLGSVADRAAWTGFVATIVRRYGRGGEFWRERGRRMPVRRWQIWNEPNFAVFWHPWPDAPAYVRLLRLAATAVRGVDPSATVIAAGLAPVEGGVAPTEFLRQMYRTPGAAAAFDVAALHPYASSVHGVLAEVAEARLVMATAGDARTPLQVTEMGVASAATGRTPFAKGRRGQAVFLERTFRALVRHRRAWRIAGIDWFAWQDGGEDEPGCNFCEFAGLVDRGDRPKPAWRAFGRFSRRAQLPRTTMFMRTGWPR
jgi:hypothetical protein